MALSLLLEGFILSHLSVPECDAGSYFEEDVLTPHLYRLFYLFLSAP